MPGVSSNLRQKAWFIDPRARSVAREISYAKSIASRPGRAVVRLLETATGRPALIRRAWGYEAEVAADADFWEVMCRRYGIRLDLTEGSLDLIPATGPLIVIANHPYGILDGLMMGRILSMRRKGEFKVLAHSVFTQAPDLDRVILPIDFGETREATERNLATRAEALRYLGEGGAIGIFPGGTVSTAVTPLGLPLDPGWRTFTAKMVDRSGAAVVPLFFEGHNSRLFQVASHVHYTLRVGLLLREFRARVDTPVRVAVGTPIPPERLAGTRGDARATMNLLRAETYRLSRRPIAANAVGHEFEAKYRTPAPQQAQRIGSEKHACR